MYSKTPGYPPPSTFMSHWWDWWLILAFPVTFFIPEVIALARHRPQDTLSAWVWRHFDVILHQPINEWSAAHALFAGGFLVVAIWLCGHFIFGWWA